MEPLSKGHFGASHFIPCRRLSSLRKSKMYCICTFGNMGSVLHREIVPFSGGPLLEVPLYYTIVIIVIFIFSIEFLRDLLKHQALLLVEVSLSNIFLLVW